MVRSLSSPTMDAFVPLAIENPSGAQFLGDGSTFCLKNAGAVEVRRSDDGTLMESYPNDQKAEGWGIPLAASATGDLIARSGLSVVDRTRNGGAAFEPKHATIYQAGDFHSSKPYLATGGTDSRCLLWDLDSGEQIAEFGPFFKEPLTLAFSPDGRFLAAAEHGVTRVWSLPPPTVRAGLPNEQTQIAISPDGTHYLPTGNSAYWGRLSETQVYHVRSGDPAGPVLRSSGTIMDAAFLKDQALCVLAVSTIPPEERYEATETAGHLEVWDFSKGQRHLGATRLPAEPRGLAVHPNGSTLGVFCAGGRAVEIDLSAEVPESREIFQRGSHMPPGDHINNGRCLYALDGEVFVAFSRGHFHIWNRRGSRFLNEHDHNAVVLDVDVHGNVLASADFGLSRSLEFFDLRSGRKSAEPIRFDFSPISVQFDRSGDRVLCVANRRIARIYNWRESIQLGPAIVYDSDVMAAKFLTGTPWVVTGGLEDGSLHVWDPKRGLPVRPPVRLGSPIKDITIVPESAQLVVAAGAPYVLDLEALLPSPDLEPSVTVDLAELDSGLRAREDGGSELLRRSEWLERWRRFRQQHPNFDGHRID